ncbi:hypothetical protein [Novipirellula galeiformis]|uniref:hypothetical protein n=1 Tax=Novipirellula galeiformis TaxID=2528004 RepID=UPI0011B6F29A|nr:hypothetical protein [Novipirellula galeiformis]
MEKPSSDRHRLTTLDQYGFGKENLRSFIEFTGGSILQQPTVPEERELRSDEIPANEQERGPRSDKTRRASRRASHFVARRDTGAARHRGGKNERRPERFTRASEKKAEIANPPRSHPYPMGWRAGGLAGRWTGAAKAAAEGLVAG